MPPIRVAIIGLSTSAKTSWAATAHLPYLVSPRGRERYTIVALCNSSLDAARKAIKSYGLPADTKAYGDPQSVADDPDIDLVVSSTRVDVHHPTILPSVKAGKKVYVEWPLAQDMGHVDELADAAKASGSRTLVGLQGRLSPMLLKIKEVLESGRIGKVLSSELRASGGTMDREFASPAIGYFADRSVGGNVLTIGFGHLFDQVQYVLGDVQKPSSRLQIQRPDFKLRDAETKEITNTIRSNVPDLIILSGSLPSSDTVQADASILIRFRRGPPFPGEPDLVWTITGEKGELKLSSFGGVSLHANAASKPVTIQVHDFATDEVKDVEWKWEDWQEELPLMARSVARLYESFYDGKEAEYPSFEEARRRHEQISGYLAKWDAEGHA